MRIKVSIDEALPTTNARWARRSPDGRITAAGVVVRPDVPYAARVQLAAEWCELLAGTAEPAAVAH